MALCIQTEIDGRTLQNCRYIWESKADGNFAVSEDTENEPLGRGTEIKLHLKEDAAKYITIGKLRVHLADHSNIFQWNLEHQIQQLKFG